MNAKDSNGVTLTRNVRQDEDGTWGANVWFGQSPAINLRRYYYQTKAQAADADISDVPGRRGCVRLGEYVSKG
jgi:hypothetical protein